VCQSEAEILATYAASGALQAIVEHQKGFFFPRGRSALAAERLRREARSREFLVRHRRLLGLVCALPYVRMVALCSSPRSENSLATASPSPYRPAGLLSG
jgi:hypothetical protein